MLSHFFGHLIKSPVTRTVLHSLGTAMLAAIGWKIGSDVYDGIKKKKGKATTEEASEDC